MNARLLTIVFMSCSLLIAKTVTQPKLRMLQADKLQDAKTEGLLANVQTRLAFVNSLPTHILANQPEGGRAGQLNLNDVTVQTISRLQKTKRDFGLVLSEVSPANMTGGQNVISFPNLQTVHEGTGLGIQEISIKGTYESLEDFEKFVATQLVEPGGSVSSLKLQGNTFEVHFQIFGQKGA